ncbi:hypothetical protein AaE_007653 [Aphanomyces astaci]|uniref:Pyrroline-5-carboxylate reductase catalytic N-terminal domain-containing protein n=1 Tax=Aphanomyces astaci TaxID=112090 RepID=A0A6A5AA20_APHAT|nr:hypothetical protein AaE_007653 [Aphanomyces astaci]
MDFNTSIDYANEITKLDPHLFSPRRLSSRIQPLYNGRTSVISHIANQCVYFSLVAHRLRLLASSTQVESSPTKVGIIGGGRVGVEIANTLLAASWPAYDLAISSRQPHEPRWMSRVDSQVARYNDNAKLAEESDVVILAMPPSQLASVGIQIKHALNLGTKALVSILAGVGNERVSKVCGSPGTLLTRVSLPQAGSPGDSNPSDAAAMQFALDNSSGLHGLCLDLEHFAMQVGIPKESAREVVVDIVLGRHGSEAQRRAHLPHWHKSWDGILKSAQGIFSQAINQMDVPTIENNSSGHHRR